MIKNIVWKIIKWWMPRQINREYDQIILRICDGLDVSDKQLYMAMSMWEGFIYLDEPCEVELSDKYWEVWRNCVNGIMLLNERERLVLVGCIMDELLAGLFIRNK